MYNGWLGATIMRQGYYIGNGETLLNWIDSKRRSDPQAASRSRPTSTRSGTAARRPARDLPGITGKVGDIKKGIGRATAARSRQRIGHYSSWNSYFTQQRVSDQALERLPQRLA